MLLFCMLLVTTNAFIAPPIQQKQRHFSSRQLSAVVDVKAASVQLLWEKLDEQKSRPVLNLSNREMSPDEASSNFYGSVDDQGAELWNQGQLWKETKQGLQVLGFDEEGSCDSLLQTCPQLYRLESEMILETCAWCIDNGFDVDYLRKEPRILSYKCKDVAYGLEFISTMLMISKDNEAALGMLVPPLLLSGIDGGLQERAVQEALGAASDATYGANRRIAGDAAASLNQLKAQRNKPI
jgi:hypothetical protein